MNYKVIINEPYRKDDFRQIVSSLLILSHFSVCLHHQNYHEYF